ncbi:hypothetical protein LguiB_003548 [Lonicera macranthoides]
MAKILGLILFICTISFSSSFSQSVEDEPSENITEWCKTTPHPGPCNYFMGRHYKQFRPKDRGDFRTLAVEVALERALHAQTCTQGLKKYCKSKRKKGAWNDCSKLYDNTVQLLNQTLEGLKANGTNCSDFDAQTWLSAALTNLETCRSGSQELNVTKFISPIVSNYNVTELISNSLAINGGLLQQQNESNDGFPNWVTAGERKLLQTESLATSSANVVVAKDGTGRFRTIQAAINYVEGLRRGTRRFLIYVKRGVYKENIEISNKVPKLMLVGDGLRYTIITSGRSVAGGFTTYSSATVGVDGIGFIARGITFRNTAGPANGQAVALRSASDLSVYYACSFEGYQDTLFVLAQRQFYKSCYIYGTIDFIFGNAAVVFQNCMILVRRPLQGQVNVITAQGRGDPYQNTGISIHNSRVAAAPDLRPVVRSFQTYLGRPWQQYSRTVFIKTYLDSLVNPAGWLAWQNSNFAWETLYYGEYGNIGPAASTRYRVKWKGYHVLTSVNVASRFTVANLIAGRAWLPATGVPFIAGL